jgi:hypothetical protein
MVDLSGVVPRRIGRPGSTNVSGPFSILVYGSAAQAQQQSEQRPEPSEKTAVRSTHPTDPSDQFLHRGDLVISVEQGHAITARDDVLRDALDLSVGGFGLGHVSPPPRP